MKKPLQDKEMEIVLYWAKTMLGNLDAQELKKYIDDKVDWDNVFNIALRHGLLNFLYLSLKTDCKEFIPEAVIKKLKTYYFQNSSKNFFLSASLIKILNLFTQNNIDAIPFKGPVQAELLYHDIGIRTFSDLDILVKKEDALQARNLLFDQGFKTNVNIPESQIKNYLKKENFFQLVNKTGTVNIDLHWEISGRYNLKPIYYPTLDRNLYHTKLLEKEIYTLSHVDLLILLCVHGTSHCWEKLELICSVAAITKSGRIGTWETVIQKVETLRCKRMVLLGLLLANYFFNTDLPRIIEAAISDDDGIENLSNYIIGKIEDNSIAFTENLSWRFSPLHFQVRDSLLDGVKYFFRLLFQPTIREWDKYPLPDSLLFLYYVLRPYRILKEGLVKQNA